MKKTLKMKICGDCKKAEKAFSSCVKHCYHDFDKHHNCVNCGYNNYENLAEKAYESYKTYMKYGE